MNPLTINRIRFITLILDLADCAASQNLSLSQIAVDFASLSPCGFLGYDPDGGAGNPLVIMSGV
jgi:hypothetical protein